MTYHVVIQPSARDEIEAAYGWIAGQSPEGAARWYNGLVETIGSLSTFPARCPRAAEDDAFEEEIRQLLYGRRGGVYRILFTVRDDEVHILHLRHGAQKPVQPEEQEGEAS